MGTVGKREGRRKMRRVMSDEYDQIKLIDGGRENMYALKPLQRPQSSDRELLGA